MKLTYEHRRSFMLWGLTFAVLALSAGIAIGTDGEVFAQDYPSNSIRLVVCYKAGGGNDIVARLIALKLTERLGQQMIVDNRPGANSAVGAEIVAKSAPDGYTLLFVSDSTITINPSLYKNLPFNADRDFIPVGMVARTPLTMFIHPSIPGKSVKEFIAYAKSNPRVLNFASPGIGTQHHIMGELLNKRAGIEMVHIPYQGVAQAFPDVLTGRVQVIITGYVSARAHLLAGKVKALAIASDKRAPEMPDVPTFEESGFPGFQVGYWFGLVAPSRTPEGIINKLNKEIGNVLQMPDVIQKLDDQGMEVVCKTPAEFADFIKKDTVKWAEMLKITNIHID